MTMPESSDHSPATQALKIYTADIPWRAIENIAMFARAYSNGSDQSDAREVIAWLNKNIQYLER
jgi:hypothetical protein